MAFDRFRKVFNNIGKRFVARSSAKRLKEHIQDVTPVDTGRLRASIEVKPGREEDDSISFLIRSEVPYAGFVEWGTAFMEGHFMFHRGTENFLRGERRQAKTVLQGEIRPIKEALKDEIRRELGLFRGKRVKMKVR